ncbi:MAG: hypothetical protein KAW12_12460 [Candidatus Aminicenantes bacterium]|nr:hypothetical protein [Candidatus Aminicenantes bacterium]
MILEKFSIEFPILLEAIDGTIIAASCSANSNLNKFRRTKNNLLLWLRERVLGIQ